MHIAYFNSSTFSVSRTQIRKALFEFAKLTKRKLQTSAKDVERDSVFPNY